MPVHETIAAVVDPLAERMPRLSAPRLTATMLVVWTGSALLACGMVWAIRLGEISAAFSNDYFNPELLPEAAMGFVLLSGIASVVLVRPHAGLGAWRVLMATAGVLAYAPLAALLWYLLKTIDPNSISPYLDPSDTSQQRLLVRVLISVNLVGLLLMLRSNARTLAARSLAIRSGRRNRQTMLGLIAAVAVATLGDVARLVGNAADGLTSDVLHGAGILLVALGSTLILLGLASALVDTIRLWPVLAHDRAGGRIALAQEGSA